VFVKICGITTEEDALLAVAMGADAIGFVFATSSRQVAVGKVAEIVRRLPPETLTIGVFRDALPERVIEVVEQAGLRGAQLHGAETHEECAEVAAKVPFVIKGLPADPARLAGAGTFAAHAILVDAPLPGSGAVFDWRIAESVPGVRRLVLAGGLTPLNVADAIRRVGPWGVDVSTGVEASPGHKDPSKVRAFIKAARDAAPSRYRSDADAPYDWQEELS
jgi:phosphoribosylanthranilate isomerase